MSNEFTANRIRRSLEHRIAARSFQLFESGKRLRHSLYESRPRATLFIFGCQRSGTTHLERLFRADPRSIVFGEFSDLSIAPTKTVWADMPELRRRIAAAEGQYVVARSLLASHKASIALDSIKPSHAVWLYRRAADVVSSMVNKWGSTFEAVSRRVETDTSGHWELEELWRDLNERTRELSDHSPGSEGFVRDLYALFWHARNADYFRLGLHRDPRISLISYETLTADPDACVSALKKHIGFESEPILSFPMRTRRKTGKDKPREAFSPDVQSRCDALYERLVAAETAVTG